MKKSVSIISFVIVVALLAATVDFSLKNNGLQTKVKQLQELLNKMQDNLKRVEEENAAAKKEKEKLQADAVSYISTNSALEDEKNRLKEAVKKSQDNITSKEAELQRMKEKIKEAEEKIARKDSEISEKEESELKNLKNKNKELEDTLIKERALYHYNLAVAFTRAGLFDDALDEYEESLKFDPNNADAQYNMGVLYGQMDNAHDKAVICYQKYLDLSPDAEDRDEIIAVINKLQGKTGNAGLQADTP